jgi:hypothetical protein
MVLMYSISPLGPTQRFKDSVKGIGNIIVVLGLWKAFETVIRIVNK